MKAIVAVDENWGIGKNNGLLFDIPEDMAFFREKTLDKVIIMGSNTLKSFPNGKPLKRRTNIVLYPGGEKRDDCIVVESLKELSLELKKYDTNNVFVVGGAMFYKTMLNYCSEIYVTKVMADGKAEVFFENLDKLDNFKMTYESVPMKTNGYTIKFTTYKNNNVLKF